MYFVLDITSTFNLTVNVDITVDELQIDDYDALAIPGGFEEFGFYSDAYDDRFLDVIRQFNQQGKTIASICVAALPLGRSGILVDRQATTYNMNNRVRQKTLAAFGANVRNEPIVVDGNIITSWNPATAMGVAFELLARLTSRHQANEIRKLMGF